MKTHIATNGNQSFKGSFFDCLCWAKDLIGEIPDSKTVVKLHRWRPGQKSLAVIAEVSSDGIRLIERGRVVPRHAFRKKYGG